MKNAIKVFVVAVMTLALSGVSFAQAKPAIPAVPGADKMMDKMADKAGDKIEEKSKGKAKGKAKKAMKKANEKAKDRMAEKKADAMERKSK